MSLDLYADLVGRGDFGRLDFSEEKVSRCWDLPLFLVPLFPSFLFDARASAFRSLKNIYSILFNLIIFSQNATEKSTIEKYSVTNTACLIFSSIVKINRVRSVLRKCIQVQGKFYERL